MAIGRPSKGLTEKYLLRFTADERWMVESLQAELRCSLNDALRICIRRGYARVQPSREVDGPVLDPNWSPAPLHTSPTPLPGQTSIDIENVDKETDQDD